MMYAYKNACFFYLKNCFFNENITKLKRNLTSKGPDGAGVMALRLSVATSILF